MNLGDDIVLISSFVDEEAKTTLTYTHTRSDMYKSYSASKCGIDTVRTKDSHPFFSPLCLLSRIVQYFYSMRLMEYSEFHNYQYFDKLVPVN